MPFKRFCQGEGTFPVERGDPGGSCQTLAGDGNPFPTEEVNGPLLCSVWPWKRKFSLPAFDAEHDKAMDLQ